MKIRVLVENNSRIDNYLLSQAALSFYIEIDDKKILFDTGYSDILIKNAKSLDIDLNKLTDIVLSHGHNDHTGGLKYLDLKNKNIKLSAHPNIFDEKFEGGIPYGCPVSRDELEKKYILNLTKKPYEIHKNLIFLGEIEGNKSFDIDDSAMVYVSDKGLFIITGCSHSGIINIINQARKITGVNNIYGVIGGMHLLDKKEEEIETVAKYLKEKGVKRVIPCHCCDLKSKIILSHYVPVEELCVGDVFENI